MSDLARMVIVHELKPYELSVQSAAKVTEVAQVQIGLAILSKEGQKQTMPLLTALCNGTLFEGRLP